MRKTWYVVLAVMVAAMFTQVSYAAEHGGKEQGGEAHSGAEHSMEHGGKEHAGVEQSAESIAEPSDQDIRNALEKYVKDRSGAAGTFDVEDAVLGKTWKLSFVKVHERVGKTGDYYYSCADFKDVDSGELLDLDLDVEDNGGVLNVVDVRIHKVGGKARYTYDENDNRIPVLE